MSPTEHPHSQLPAARFEEILLKVKALTWQREVWVKDKWLKPFGKHICASPSCWSDGWIAWKDRMGRHKLLLSPLCCLQSLLTPTRFYVHCEHMKPTDSTLSDWNVLHWGSRSFSSHQFLASSCSVAALCCKMCMMHHPMESLGLFPQATARPL